MTETITTIEPTLLAKLDELAERYEQITQRMNDPAVVKDPAQLVALSKEQAKLRRIVEPYDRYKQTVAQIAESESILADPQADAELKQLATEELGELRAAAAEQIEQLKDAIIAGDEADIGAIILEIRAGTGGEEAALFARDLFEMYQRYCDQKGFALEVLDASTTDLGGFKEVVVSVKGPGVYERLRFEGGGHRVQRVPRTEAQGRIHTSAATVAVLPEPEEVDIKIDWDKDVDEFVSRAGGPGGQNVNKVSSAIRLVHRETGITVSMRDEKSQHRNRAKARRVLMSRLFDHIMRQQTDERTRARRTMIGSGDRSERIRTYNFPQNRCTDHRINLDLYKLDRIMAGELDELIDKLRDHDRQQRLKNL